MSALGLAILTENSKIGLESNCLLCRAAVEKYAKTKFHLPWIESFTQSLCEVLGLEHSIQAFLKDAVYCDSCLCTIRDIDFTLQNIHALQLRLDYSRGQVEKLLCNNFEQMREAACELEDDDDDRPSPYELVVMDIWRALPHERKILLGAEDNNGPGRGVPHRHRIILRVPEGGSDNSDVDFSPDSELNDENGCEESPRRRVTKRKGNPKPVKNPRRKSKTISKGESSDAIKTEKLDSHGSDPKAGIAIKAEPNSDKDENCKVEIPIEISKRKSSRRKKQRTINEESPEKIKILRCTFDSCKFATQNVDRFQVHVRVHDGDLTPYHCTICQEAKFANRYALYDHRKKRCPARTEACKKGRTGRRYRNDSATDVEESDSEEPGKEKIELRCTYEGCDFFTTAETRFQTHLRAHSGDPTPYHCTKCEKKFPAAKHLNLHRHRNCGNVFTCSVPNCGSVFPTKFGVKTHMSTRHYNIDKLTCMYCSKIFTQSEEEEYRKHLETHEIRETENRKFSCVLPDCGKVFTNSKDLKAHVVEQHEELSSKCDICQAILANPISLKRHHIQMHGQPNVSLQCDQCSYIAKSKAGLVIHQNKHSKTQQHACPLCEKRFFWPNGLRTHMRNHTNLKPYKCTFTNCGKAFVTSGKLRDHEEVHSQIRSYICDRCSKTFKAKKNLEQHFRYVHRKEEAAATGEIAIKRKERKPRARKEVPEESGATPTPAPDSDPNPVPVTQPEEQPSDEMNSDFLTTHLEIIADDSGGIQSEQDQDPTSVTTFTLGSSSSWQYTGLPGQQFLNPLIHPENNTTFYFPEIQ